MNPLDEPTNAPPPAQPELPETIPSELGPPEPGSPELGSVELARYEPMPPRCLHPSSIVFQMLGVGRQAFGPVLLGVYWVSKGSWVGGALAAMIVIPLLLFAIIRYWTLRYRIADGELLVQEGLLFRKNRTVPIDRIQNVDLVQNVLHRLLQVAEVRVETASGNKPEATLQVLSMRDVDRLKQAIFNRSGAVDVIGDQSVTSPIDIADDAERGTDVPLPQQYPIETLVSASRTLLTIPTWWLVKTGLASNRGLIMLSVVVGLFWPDNFDDSYVVDRVSGLLPNSLDSIGWMVWLLIFTTAMVIIRILGVGWHVLRFHGYSLQLVGDDLQVSCGLLTKVSATVPRRRIQFISIHRSPVQRWMKLSSIRIETAGGAGGNRENAATTITRRWFVPVLPDARVGKLLAELRPGFVLQPAELDWRSVAPLAGRRLARRTILISLLIGIVTGLTRSPWGYAMVVPAWVLQTLWMRRSLRRLGYARQDDAILFRSGVWTQKTSVTFCDRVQTLEYSQSPFDRRWKMATLTIDTAAAGPADHQISLKYFDADWTNSETEQLTSQSAASSMIWN